MLYFVTNTAIQGHKTTCTWLLLPDRKCLTLHIIPKTIWRGLIVYWRRKRPPMIRRAVGLLSHDVEREGEIAESIMWCRCWWFRILSSIRSQIYLDIAYFIPIFLESDQENSCFYVDERMELPVEEGDDSATFLPFSEDSMVVVRWCHPRPLPLKHCWIELEFSWGETPNGLRLDDETTSSQSSSIFQS